MFKKIKQIILKRKYKNTKKIYIVCLWAKWAVLEAQFTGRLDKNGDPLTIQYTDHNGLCEQYYIAPWYKETTGLTIAYFFNKTQAQELAKLLNYKGA